MVTSTLARAHRRFIARYPGQLALALVGIAIGVAVVVAVDLANASARKGFALSVEALAGTATQRIVGADGALDQSVYVALRVDRGLRQSAPVVAGIATTEGGETLRVLGVDPLTDDAFRNLFAGLEASLADDDANPLLSDPRAVLLAERTARRLGLELNESFTVSGPGGRKEVRISGLLTGDPRRQAALDGVLIIDIAGAQALLDKLGKLTRIDLAIDDPEQLAELASWLPPNAVIEPAEAERQGLLEMTEAFHLNLAAMALLALLVGLFLVYNTAMFTVLQRRALFARMRLIGTSGRVLLRMTLSEILVLALVGTLLGLLLGVALGQGLVHLVTRTIDDLYFTTTVTAFLIDPWSLLKGAGLGLAGSLAAALPPAIEAARTEPAEALSTRGLERRAGHVSSWLAAAGLGLVAIGAGTMAWPSDSLLLAYIGMFAAVVGATLLVPSGVRLLTALWAAPLTGLGALAQLANREVARSLSRTGPAVAALAVAVATTISVGLMINSFRTAVVDWLDQTLQADLYLSSEVEGQQDLMRDLPEDLPERLGEIPGVTGVVEAQRVTVRAPQTDGPAVAHPLPREISVLVLGGTPTLRGFDLKAALGPAPLERWRRGEGLLISEPLSTRTGLAPGDTLVLRTAEGVTQFTVLGVFHEYGAGTGLISMTSTLYRAHWGEPQIDSIGIEAADGVDLEALRSRVQTELNALAGDERPPPVLTSTAEIRTLSLEIFDRTFAITDVLRLLSVIVAFVGIVSALMALQLERGRELAMLRVIGATPGQIRRVVLAQTALLGLFAGLLAIPLGVGMGWILVEVVNLRAFGWTMPFRLDGGLLLSAVVLAVIAALAGGVYPAQRTATAVLTKALRES